MISVDDMNDWVGCLDGYPGIQTPNIDKLAAEGINFTNAHCPSPKCGPSRTAILTGLRPSTSGIYDNNQWWKPNLPDVKTLPMYFRENGYHVLGAGKIFHHTAGNNPPEQWDEYFHLVFDDPWDRTRPNQRHIYPTVEVTEFPGEIPLNGILPFKHEFDWGSLDKAPGQYGDALSIAWGIDQLNRQHEKPFFLAIGLFHPHLPWYAPQEYFDQYPLENIHLPEVPENDLDDIPVIGQELAKAGRADFQRVLESNQWSRAIQAYLASISFADALVGQLLKALKASEYANNTMVIFWSDHGWHLGEKEHWHKSTLWERATHVPFIIREPGSENGQENASPVNLLDIYPTLVEYCGLAPMVTNEGKSLVPLLQEPGQYSKDPTLITFRKGNHALRGSRWKYIRYHDGGEELYDLENDYHEWHNLASDPSFDSIKSSMKAFLPLHNAETKPAKSAYIFDFETYTWTRRKAE